jgi:ribose transport system ATP-binding protein
MLSTVPAVRMTGITKAFNGIPVLHGVDFELAQGEVHALIGGNGAGKSTLMKILEGVYTADSGTIAVDGKPVQIRTPEDARRNGIAMIFQEFSLVPTLSVAQNIFLAREPRTTGGLLDDREAERRTRDLFHQLDVDVDPRAPMAGLATGYWQLTEIAKALSINARVLIMDEPTSSLTASETQGLFALIDRLQKQGISIIYISHRMQEIFGVADRVTVLRDGRVVITEPVATLTMERVIEQIVGQKMEQAFAWKERPVNRSGPPLLTVRDLASGRRVRDVSFDLYPGEILGLAGLMGSGRTELARALFGIDPISAGTVEVRGRPVDIHRPEDALAAGICLVPEDRRIQGLVLDHTVKDNLLLPLLGRIQQGGLINDQRGNELVEQFVASLRVKTDSIFKQVRLLSGGNQQKVVIAKWLAYAPEILIMDEPTAGIDIGAKTEILDVIRRLADSGKGIIVISSELTELLAVSDRVIVLRDGVSKRALLRQEIQTEEMLHHVVQTA